VRKDGSVAKAKAFAANLNKNVAVRFGRAKSDDNPSEESMNAIAHSTAPAFDLRPLLDRLERDHFPASRFAEPRPGTVTAQFFASRLTSAFQPIVRATDGGIAGHHALLRVFDTAGESAAPWGLFAHAAEDAMLVQLDRLTRTVHALNYFPGEDTGRTLFLNVEQRLLNVVAEDHGAYFELILKALGIAPARVAIVMPAGVLDDPVTFVRAAISYRIRGYRVLAQLRGEDSQVDLEHVFLADPHFVALDGPAEARSDETRTVVQALSRRGIHSVARRIEDEAQAQAARDVGFGFLSGWHFAAPGARA
jgi:EAL domain-containing protein (putative c-di-GMP-specific phosphodiesterase class I)